MKNTINYYYQFNIENLHFVSGVYYFSYLNRDYKLVEYKKDPLYIKPLVILNQNKINSNKYFHEIVFTKDNAPYIFIDNKCYILLRLSKVINDKISFYDIFQNREIVINELKSLIRFDWSNLWSNKIDYLEEILRHSENKYFDVLPIFYFFIGLGENAISYYQNTLLNKKRSELDYYTICHDRISSTTNVSDLYNPLDIIFDHRSRDVAEYIKSLFINNEYDYSEIDEYITSLDFSIYGFSLLYSRLLFPSFFFDMCDNIFNGNLGIVELFKLGDKIDEYRLFLKEIYYIIRKKTFIDEVGWIIKK